MPDISLTQLVDVVSKSGAPKATCVRQIKAQLSAPYDPRNDFYKLLREAIIEAHSSGLGKSHITAAAAMVADPRRAAQYGPIATAYNSWWGRKTVSWFAPPRSTWAPPGSLFGVTVNPELGLDINGARHVVKLYFNADQLSKARVDIITQLIHDEFGQQNAGLQFSVLDIRNKKLHTVVPPTGLGPAIVAEIAYIATLWPLI
jgi:hypothetical protein